ncbi:DNA repair protein RAD4 isoform X2 [Malania oleifera]|uniref:DNA repair protein RAD4 isoform X2 n=1 Tax=Malania oleifera TaxID=397392 RepID=UPI0025ADAC73|nr:DNA repair protein RAD4 isoform X2 [Malania oleifera]
MRTRSLSKGRNELPGTLTDESREAVGKLLRRANSRGAAKTKKQDGYLRQCDSVGIASLLSLIPAHLLNISEVSKLTVKALAPLVCWFHSNFRIRSLTNAERSIPSALAYALESREGTSEEVAALSVALFRALNLTTRFVSILDVASLKPDADKYETLTQDASRAVKGIFSSSTLMVHRPNQVSTSPKMSACDDKDKVCERGGCKRKNSDSSGKNNQPNDSPLADQLKERIFDSLACEGQNDISEECLVNKFEGSKGKGDLEFEMQLEMALSATAIGTHENSVTSDVKDLHSDSSNFLSPLKRMKRIKSEEPSTSSQGISTAIGSTRAGPPLYWAEVYCSGENLTGKWVHVDAVNAILDREQNVEAAAAACKTSLRYVVAFAGHGAKDVTRRYCMKWYKISSQRIDSNWWDAVLAPLKELESGATGGQVSLPREPDIEVCDESGKKIDAEASVVNSIIGTRNSLEDMELDTRALTEPLPTNQQAYRSHQLYAIERWLTKYQILHPKGPVLGFCSGHPVYPRTCVQTLKTKERWLRDGLQVKANELPAKVLKRPLKLNKVEVDQVDEYSEGDGGGSIALYGKWQMEPLCLPHAVNGVVPKNERGQVDVWSEKCLPPGTVHLRLPRVVPVAKRLEIDFAPAMVGFEFRNGRSIPVFEGIVVCAEFKDAILEAYMEEEERREAEEKKRNETQAISRWYQLLSSIVTRQRLNNSYGSGLLSQATVDYQKTNSESCARFGGSSDDRESRQQGYTMEGKLQAPLTKLTEDQDHEHVFLTEDQSSDAQILVRTKRCHCGFSVQVEEL